MKEVFKLVAVVPRQFGIERIIFRRKIGPCVRDEAIRIASECVVRKETPDAAEYWLVPLAESETGSHRIETKRSSRTASGPDCFSNPPR